MPVYDSHLLNDQGIADIYAYLLSQPATKSPATIPILAAVTTGTGPSGAPSATARGAEAFAANCAACHGAQGQGGVGPSLKNESARKDTAAVTAFVKNPSGAMPKLFPSVLNENDVSAVAAYVGTLK
jgi:mono/diheme cytochrome c family protein